MLHITTLIRHTPLSRWQWSRPISKAVALKSQVIATNQLPHEKKQDLIILHGLLGSGTNWSTVAKDLIATSKSLDLPLRIHMLDLRNHGHSPHNQDASIQSMTEDLDLYIKTRTDQAPIILLGHSLGGKISMRYALERPHSIDKLVIVDITPEPSQDSSHNYIFDTLLSTDLSKMKSMKEVDNILAPKFEDVGLRRFLMMNLIFVNGEYKWRVPLQSLKDGLPEIHGINLVQQFGGKTFDGKTLFIRGGRSHYVQDKNLPAIKALFPSSTVETIAHAGHWPHAEQKEAFVQVLKRFIWPSDENGQQG
eukprot:TRINITY_DN18881_c0_g1_i1.p1 TRINITY_DN18881_c0_g1~~TRINITY_DN18881_c0_g1_i1.p1  ORF type:complete len:307 (+),score=46.78 TRINITY_DN18881_c0_g1_i1:147-1067(+)